MQGRIDKLIEDRGYGFIKGDTGRATFFHVSQCPRFDDLQVGDEVSYEIETNINDGRAEARNVKPVAEP